MPPIVQRMALLKIAARMSKTTPRMIKRVPPDARGDAPGATGGFEDLDEVARRRVRSRKSGWCGLTLGSVEVERYDRPPRGRPNWR
jgi:hypothetical protein